MLFAGGVIGGAGNGERGGFGTALLVAAARRDYFLTIQHGKKSTTVLQPGDRPSRDDASQGGLRWLARILTKTRAKLRGELHPVIIYGCDRGFLEPHGVHAADFLRAVWAAGEDDQKLLSWLRAQLQAQASIR